MSAHLFFCMCNGGSGASGSSHARPHVAPRYRLLPTKARETATTKASPPALAAGVRLELIASENGRHPGSGDEDDVDDGFPRVIALLGVVHGAAASVRAVEQLIAELEPDAVVLELCRTRAEAVLATADGDAAGGGQQDAAAGGRRRVRPAMAVLSAVMANTQRRAAKVLGVQPGEEMRAACASARHVGSRVVLGDMLIDDTFRALLRRSPRWETARLLWELSVGPAVEQLWKRRWWRRGGGGAGGGGGDGGAQEEATMEGALQALKQRLPTVYQLLWTVREARFAWVLTRSPAVRDVDVVLAVVGLSHLAALVRRLQSGDIPMHPPELH